MTDFIKDTPGTEIDTRKPWIAPDIKMLTNGDDVQGGITPATFENVTSVTNYRPS